MATLIIKNNTALDQDIVDRGTFVPASGDITVTEAASLVWFASSRGLRGKVANGTFTINNGSGDLSTGAGLSYLTSLFAFAGFDSAPSSCMTPPFMPGRLRRQWWIQQNSGLPSPVNSGFLTAPTTNGTASSVHDADGQWLNYATASIADRDGGWISSAFTQVQRQDQPVFEVLIKMGSALSDIQNVRIWNGLFSASPVASALPAIHLAAFRYDTGADGTAFWRCITNDGGAGTVTVTGVAVAQNTQYKLRIDMSNSGDVRFYINDVLVATHVTTLPGSTQNLGHVGNIRTLVAATKNCKISKIFMEHN